MKKIILILSIILATSCSSDDDNSTTESSPINFIEIGKGNTGVNDNNPQNLVIRTQEEWSNLLDYFPSSVIDEFNETTIDFNQFMVIAMIAENKPDNGYLLNILDVVESENTISVSYEIEDLNAGYTVIIQPFAVIKIAKSEKTVIFE